MTHTNLDAWKKDVEDRHYTVKQVQGFEQFEALDGNRVVGRWNAEDGYLEEVESTIVDPTGEPVRYEDPTVSETNVTDVKP